MASSSWHQVLIPNREVPGTTLISILDLNDQHGKETLTRRGANSKTSIGAERLPETLLMLNLMDKD